MGHVVDDRALEAQAQGGPDRETQEQGEEQGEQDAAQDPHEVSLAAGESARRRDSQPAGRGATAGRP